MLVHHIDRIPRRQHSAFLDLARLRAALLVRTESRDFQARSGADFGTALVEIERWTDLVPPVRAFVPSTIVDKACDGAILPASRVSTARNGGPAIAALS
jgi:hypothetical protein